MPHCSVCQPLRPVEVWISALFSSWDIFLACHPADSSLKRSMLCLVHAYGHNPIPTWIEHIVIGISFLGYAFSRWLHPIIPFLPIIFSTCPGILILILLYVQSGCLSFFEHFSWNLGKSLSARACLVSFVLVLWECLETWREGHCSSIVPENPSD